MSNKLRPPHATMTTSCPAPTMATKFVQEGAWALRLHCASVGGSEQAVASSSHLCEPTLCVQSCLLLDSDASAELGDSADAEFFASPQAVMDDRETHRDCLVNDQCKPPSSDRPDTLALIHRNPPSLSTHSDTDHILLSKIKKKVFCCVCIRTSSCALHITKSCQMYAFDE